MMQADSIFLEGSLLCRSSGDGVAGAQWTLAFTESEKQKVEHSIFFLTAVVSWFNMTCISERSSTLFKNEQISK